MAKNLRVNVEVFNLLNAAASDIDSYYVSRLPGEPADGVADIHTHPRFLARRESVSASASDKTVAPHTPMYRRRERRPVVTAFW